MAEETFSMKSGQRRTVLRPKLYYEAARAKTAWPAHKGSLLIEQAEDTSEFAEEKHQWVVQKLKTSSESFKIQKQKLLFGCLTAKSKTITFCTWPVDV